MILHPGRAQDWWHGPTGLAYFDGEVFHAGEVRVRLPDCPRVVPTEAGWIVAADGVSVRITDGKVERSERDRFGATVVARRARRWSIDALALPLGARESPSLTPFPTGHGAVWKADGFVYRMSESIRPVAPEADFIVGPHGAILLGDRAAHSRGSAQTLAELSEPIRWRSDGGAIRGMSGADAVSIDLLTGETSRTTGVIPVSFEVDLHLDSGQIRRGNEVLQWGVIEASCARSGRLLAGPGGVIWDLECGEPLFKEARILLGATLAVEGGFATAHWESGRGRVVSPTGEILSEFRLPIDGDDVLSGVGEGGIFLSAEGHAWDIDGREVTPSGVLKDPANATVGGRCYAWADDGPLTVEPV